MALLPSQRSLFDIPDDVGYFNCAYNSPQLIRSRDRLIEGAMQKCHPWNRKPDDFFKEAECIRSLASAALGGDADGYAIIPSASYGISTAARALEPTLGKGDKILVIDEAFPSNYLPWEKTAAITGAEIITAQRNKNQNWTDAILTRIDETVKAVAVPNCHWTNGAKIDLESISRACKSVGAMLAIDATQSLAAMPFDFETIRPDFVVASGYKWLLCPYGFSLMYVGLDWRNSRPLEESWLARDNAGRFEALVNYSDRYMPGARRFDVGEKNTATILPGAIAALEQIAAWGVENIAATINQINSTIADRLEALGFFTACC